jgi:hypothetical protein
VVAQSLSGMGCAQHSFAVNRLAGGIAKKNLRLRFFFFFVILSLNPIIFNIIISKDLHVINFKTELIEIHAN